LDLEVGWVLEYFAILHMLLRFYAVVRDLNSSVRQAAVTYFKVPIRHLAGGAEEDASISSTAVGL
jgi:hypothetical protein